VQHGTPEAASDDGRVYLVEHHDDAVCSYAESPEGEIRNPLLASHFLAEIWTKIDYLGSEDCEFLHARKTTRNADSAIFAGTATASRAPARHRDHAADLE
jgi:hypothetical protein